jgi:hypothetical protein
MSRFVPVSFEKWGEMVKALADVERLKAERVHDLNQIGGLQEENARLKAEVERLTALVESNLNQSKRAMANSDAYVRSLEAQVERLTKAIDLTIIDLDERHERQDLRAWEFAELLRKAKGVQS